jgi:fibronectin-binding autotransporter adhesin
MKSITRTMTTLALLTAFLILSSSRNAQAATCTWIGGSGNWNEAAKWSCVVVPGAGDDATIAAGTVTLTEDVTVGSLTLSGGTLTGAGNLAAGTINWSAGTMSGSGSTTATATVSFTGGTAITLTGRTFNNAGAATWSRGDSGRLYLQDALAVFNNLVGATFTIQSSGDVVMSGTGTFNNAGTLTKSSPDDTTQIAVAFVNAVTGVVEVASGTLWLNNMVATTSGGGYHVHSGATLRLSGQKHTLTGNIVGTGDGTIEMSSRVDLDGTLTFPGVLSLVGNGVLTLSTEVTTAEVGTLDLSGTGTLTGPGDLTAGTINLSGGTMSGSGSTTATTALSFDTSGTVALNGRTFNNAGDAIWNGSGYLTQTADSVFNNLEHATLTIQTSGSSFVIGTGEFNNAGTLTKSSLDNSVQISDVFVNAGTGVIEVESGTLVISNGANAAASSGGYNILSGAKLRLTGNAHNLTGDIAGTGGGTIEAAATVNLDGTLAFPGAFTVASGGTLNLSTDATTANIGTLNLTGGVLTGPGDLTAGTINWSAGTMSGSGSTTASSAANFTGGSTLVLNSRTFNNDGAATWTKTGGSLAFQNAATVFNNRAGATFTVQSTGTDITQGTGVFNNAGTLNLTTGRFGIATFAQSPGGITNLAIGGETPLTQFCQLVTTQVELAGALDVTFAGGYTPQVGDHYVLLTYSTRRTGAFSPVDVTPVGDILWEWFYQGNALHLWAMRYRAYQPLVLR